MEVVSRLENEKCVLEQAKHLLQKQVHHRDEQIVTITKLNEKLQHQVREHVLTITTVKVESENLFEERTRKCASELKAFKAEIHEKQVCIDAGLHEI